MVKIARGEPVAVQARQGKPASTSGEGCEDEVLRVDADVWLEVGFVVVAHLFGDRIRLLCEGQDLASLPASDHQPMARCLGTGVRYEGSVLAFEDGTAEIHLGAIT